MRYRIFFFFILNLLLIAVGAYFWPSLLVENAALRGLLLRGLKATPAVEVKEIPSTTYLDAELGESPAPNLTVLTESPRGSISARHNSLGFLDLERPANTHGHRIALVGDEMLLSYFLSPEAALTEQLNRTFAESETKATVDFSAFGFAGWGTANFVGAIKKFVSVRSPHEIWIFFSPHRHFFRNSSQLNAPPLSPLYSQHAINFGYGGVPETRRKAWQERARPYEHTDWPTLFSLYVKGQFDGPWRDIHQDTLRAFRLVREVAVPPATRLTVIYLPSPDEIASRTRLGELRLKRDLEKMSYRFFSLRTNAAAEHVLARSHEHYFELEHLLTLHQALVPPLRGLANGKAHAHNR